MIVILQLDLHGTAVQLDLDAEQVWNLSMMLQKSTPVFSTHDGHWHHSDRPCMPTLTIVPPVAIVPRMSDAAYPPKPTNEVYADLPRAEDGTLPYIRKSK
jgi:hypothetical protein